MADITWPVNGGRAFAPLAHDEAVEFDVEITTKRNGRVSTRSLPGARWRATLQFDRDSVANIVSRRQLEAFLLTLRGGADRLLLWNLLTPEPLGTMRGTVTLAASAAAGAVTASITGGAEAPNVVRGSGFEVDTNADGRADNWLALTQGSVGTVSYSRVAGNFSTYAQRVDATALGTAGTDRAGLQYQHKYPVTPGQAWTLGADTQDSGVPVRLYIDWFDAGGSILSTASTLFPSGGASWVRRTLTAVAPANAVDVLFYIWIEARPTSAGAAWLQVDNVQLEPGSVGTGYRGFPNLLRGDRVGIGGQRVVLTADASAGDSGACAISFRPALRAAASAGAAVTLVRPTTRYVLTTPMVPMPAAATELPGFSIELVEE